MKSIQTKKRKNWANQKKNQKLKNKKNNIKKKSNRLKKESKLLKSLKCNIKNLRKVLNFPQMIQHQLLFNFLQNSTNILMDYVRINVLIAKNRTKSLKKKERIKYS